MSRRLLQAVLLLAVVLPIPIFAQVQTHLDQALRYVEQQRTSWGYSEDDIKDLIVSDAYTTKNNGVTHYFFIQRYKGIEVYNAITNVHISSAGKVFHSGHRFVADLRKKANATKAVLTPEQAVQVALRLQGLEAATLTRLPAAREDVTLFSRGNFSRVDVPVRLKYMPVKDGSLRLVWDLSMDPVNGLDYWSMRIDALTGELTDRTSWTQHCSFHPNQYTHACVEQHIKPVDFCTLPEALVAERRINNFASASYRVFPLPVEAPTFGDRALLTAPGNPDASPFGWHDDNGIDGADYTITRGNNVFAFPDRDANYISGIDVPDGGASLVFDYPIDTKSEPSTYTSAATTNLFYMVNMMHDFTYAYGFDEVSGNFQSNNYDKGGAESDYVVALAQFDGISGVNINNADFSTPGDGGNGQMRMFEWTASGVSVVNIDAPGEIAGGVESSTATFGAPITTVPLTGDVVIAKDASTQPELGCKELVDPQNIAGKIAMVDRGSCFFIEKTLEAEAAGAIACLICNYENNVIGMGPGTGFPNPNIPAVMLKSSDCQRIRQQIASGKQVTLTLKEPDTGGPIRYDGSLDNGIIAHEYGHGISNRLTGGPSNSGCLGNAEQMGEGWSDFFSLVTTTKAGDKGENPRGIGTFVQRQATSGSGIRRFPYCTDMNINPQTYDDIIGTDAPHPVGEVWVDMLWDMYWKLVEKYGYDPDLIHGTGGNNIAIRLVMDGMRYQPCGPGFTEGRDAILAADQINYDGANQCLIWEAFARRGLGYSANQGNPDDQNDGTQGFDIDPRCIQELKIAKKVTETIEAGEIVDVELVVTNHKLTGVTNVSVSDPIPAGLTYISGSASNGGTLNGQNLVFNLGNMAPDQSITLTYKALSDANAKSITQYYDGMEGSSSDWISENIEGNVDWKISTTQPASGAKSWYVEATNAVSKVNLYLLVPNKIGGAKPILSLMHNYLTQPGTDGGFFEISTDFGATYHNLQQYIFKNSYRGKLDYNTFTLPNLRGYWGDSDGYINTLIDLSAFAGQEVSIRYRFATDDSAWNQFGNKGWFIDDVYVLDALFYNSQACVSSSEGDNACAEAPFRGTLVKGSTTVGTKDISELPWKVQVMPNPAGETAQVLIAGADNQNMTVRLLNLQGQVLQSKTLRLNGTSIPMDLSQVAAGMYLVQVSDGAQSGLYKLIKR